MSHGLPIRCHTAFKHYLNFHKDYGCSCGCCNSIFSGSRTTINYNINDGGFWGGFWNTLGGFCGGIFGGMFGGFMNNLFGGFGMGGFMGIGNGGFGGGWGGWNGGWNAGNNSNSAGSRKAGKTEKDDETDNNKKAKKSDKTDPSDKTDKPESKCDDKDWKEYNNLRKEFDTISKNPTKENLKALYDKVKPLTEKPVDDAHKDDNIEAYKKLLSNIEDCAKRNNIDLNGNGNVVGEKNDANGKINTEENSNTFPTSLTDDDIKNIEADINEIGTDKLATSDKIENLKIYQATDKVKRPVIRNSQGDITMSGNFGNTNFPLDMSITTASGETHKYRCIHVTAAGYAIYATPTKDTNNNKYILTIINGQLELTQGTKLSGLADLQCKQ